MDKVSVAFKVLFEDPFWIGILERKQEGTLSVSKVTFGPEPKDYEVYEYLLKHFYRLRFSPPVAAAGKEMRINPKRMQREVHRQVSDTGMGTKSQQALKLQQEEIKMERRKHSREQREADKQRQFELRQQKKREKHRGR